MEEHLAYLEQIVDKVLYFFIDFCVVAVKTSMGLVRSRIRLTEIRLVFNYLLEFFSFPWLLEISYAISKLTIRKISFFFPHFRCQFVSFFFVVNVPTTTAPILMSTLARRRKCARIFSKGSVHEDSRFIYSLVHYLLFAALAVCITM